MEKLNQDQLFYTVVAEVSGPCHGRKACKYACVPFFFFSFFLLHTQSPVTIIL